MLLQNLVNSYGTVFIAGFSAASKIDSFAFLPIATLANATTTYVGQNIGAKRFDRVQRGVKAALVISLTISALIIPVSMIFGPNLISLFQNDFAVIQAGMAYLKGMLPFIMLLSVLMILNAALRGAGEALIPLVSTTLSLWVARIPLAYFFAARFGRDSMFYSYPAGWLAGLLFLIPYYVSGRWQKRIRLPVGGFTVADAEDRSQREGEGGTGVNEQHSVVIRQISDSAEEDWA
jgi:Na+-driven multidrug efflux pump